MEIEGGTYLLENIGFNLNNQPVVTLITGDTISDVMPLGYHINVTVNITERFCTGWRDIATGERFACPDKLVLNEKFHQCPKCQKRTGFNPAFYNATHVSEQQEARNREPHFLYLAYFGPDTIKIGISYAKRGILRLLEQGARSALILDTFSSAITARQYEAKIATLPHICETVLLSKKQSLLSLDYHRESAVAQLIDMRTLIEQQLGIQFAKHEVLTLDDIYFPDGLPPLKEAFDCSQQYMLSGKVIGQIGSLLFCRYKSELVYLPLKKFVGYRLAFSNQPLELTFPARQASLF